MATKRKTEIAAAAAAPAPARAPRKAAPATHARRGAKATTSVPTESPVAEIAPVVAAPKMVTHDDIARLAYSYWEARGYQGGSPEHDWLRAEAELQSR